MAEEKCSNIIPEENKTNEGTGRNAATYAKQIVDRAEEMARSILQLVFMALDKGVCLGTTIIHSDVAEVCNEEHVEGTQENTSKDGPSSTPQEDQIKEEEADNPHIKSVLDALNDGYYMETLLRLLLGPCQTLRHRAKKEIWGLSVNSKVVRFTGMRQFESLFSKYFASMDKHGKTEIATLLMNYDAPCTVKAKFYFRERNPLIQAAESGNLESVKQLLNQKCHVGHMGIYVRYALLTASCEGHTNILHFILNDQANCVTVDINTSLLLAAANGHNKTTEFLIQHKINKNKQLSTILGTALHVAIQAGHAEVVRTLLEAKCNVESVNNMTPWLAETRMTPLIHACQSGHAAIVDILISYNCDVNAKDADGKDPLSIVLKGHHSSANTLAKSLLAGGARVNCPCFADGEPSTISPLQLAITHANTEIVETMLNHGANPNHKYHVPYRGTQDCMTPLASVIYRKNTEMLIALLKHGAMISHVYDVAPIFILGVPGSHVFFSWNSLVLLYLAGLSLSSLDLNQRTAHNTVAQFILDDQETLLPLTGLCRRQIRSHLLSSLGGNHSNLIQAIPWLPLPRPLKMFLFFMENASHYKPAYESVHCDQEAVLPLTGLCRQEIRTHLCALQNTGDCSYLMSEIFKLPIPQRLKLYLMFVDYTSEADGIPPEVADFINSIL